MFKNSNAHSPFSAVILSARNAARVRTPDMERIINFIIRRISPESSEDITRAEIEYRSPQAVYHFCLGKNILYPQRFYEGGEISAPCVLLLFISKK